MTLKRNDKASKARRQQGALARFTIDPDRARADKHYQERKERELAALKNKLSRQLGVK